MGNKLSLYQVLLILVGKYFWFKFIISVVFIMGLRNSKNSLDIATASKTNGTEANVKVKEIKEVPESEVKSNTETTAEPQINGNTVESESPPVESECAKESAEKQTEESKPTDETETRKEEKKEKKVKKKKSFRTFSFLRREKKNREARKEKRLLKLKPLLSL